MRKQTKEQWLPDELVWADGGHASDVALTAMADGQVEIVPRAVLAHVEACPSCTTHLGNAALLSLHAGREIARLCVGVGASAGASAAVPRVAIALALVVAVLGLVPTLLDAPSEIGGARAFALHVPMFMRGLGTLGRHVLSPSTPFGAALTYGAAALLVIMALSLVRLLPKKEVSS